MADPEGTTTGEAMLNERQREAVEYDGGPLVVLAGPGTGKTRVITHRVGRIIREGAAPESVLALTYTVKAAEELRSRLAEMVSPAAADRLNAHTFHGFGYRLVARFRDYLGLPRDLKIIDPAQTRRLLRQLIAEHNLFPELVPEGREGVIDEVRAVMACLANCAVFAPDAAAFCAAWRRHLDESDPPADADQAEAERERCRRLEDSVRLYTLYADECARRGWASFDDLMLLPVRLLRDHAGAAAVCRDEFRHIVVDEFQDANAAQIELLRLLCPPRERGRQPDLCVVGDDDQSIYEFRGADDQAFFRFQQIWKSPHRVSLSDNYRSRKPVIDVANHIISRAPHRYDPDKRVVPARRPTDASPDCPVECITLADDWQAGEVIAAMILADRQRAGDNRLPWSSYAVICRTNQYLDHIGHALVLEGIPIRRGRADAEPDAAVHDALQWVDLLVSPGGDSGLFAAQWLLTRPPFSIPGDLVRDWTQTYRAERSRRRAGEGRGSTGHFIRWLAERHGGEEGTGAKVRRFAALAEELQREALQTTADAALFEIIRRADLAHSELLPARDRARRISRLADMLRYVRDHLDAFDPPGDLAAFWSYYQDMDDEERTFRSAAIERLEGARDEPDTRPDGVTLLTAHSAKGLEFDTVFIPRVRPGHGFPASYREPAFLPPEGLVSRPDAARTPQQRHEAEERRLFYVAATRAQRRLVLLAAARKTISKSIDYFNEITLQGPCADAVLKRDAEDVLNEAAAAGVRTASRGELDAAAEGVRRVAPATGREIIDNARRGARLAAAQALEMADRPDATADAIAAAQEALRDAAERIAVATYIGEHREIPAWVAARGPESPLARYATRLLQAVSLGSDETGPGFFFPLKPPLELSYTWIEEYLRCPRCFFLRRIVRIPEPPGRPQVVGSVVHAALADFHRRCAAADADGGPRPGLDELLRAGRAEYFRQVPVRCEADAEQLNQIQGQLRLFFEKLYNPRDEVERVEFTIRFPYIHTPEPEDNLPGPSQHEFEVRLDRLDRITGAAAGHRIIDFKTGQATKRLLEPKPDDLQLGVYAMALQHHQGGVPGGDPPVGVAEYWVLSRGEAGRIDLAEIRYDRVMARINEAVSGMLAGRWPRGQERDCSGLCAMLLDS